MQLIKVTLSLVYLLLDLLHISSYLHMLAISRTVMGLVPA